jgi:energy-coupling factor transport system ATP-binding protein
VRDPLLTAHVRSFAYDDDGPEVLRDVRLELVPGSLTAVLGASGSGKSTLAKVLAGWAIGAGHGRFTGVLELTPRSGIGGRLEFAGKDADPRLQLGTWGSRVAYMPQRAADLLTGAAGSVGEELAFSLEQHAVPRAKMEARVRQVAASVGLEGLLARNPNGLSGGEQRRLALGAALVGRPDVVLLDEPAASLDAAGEEALARVVAELRDSGAAVVHFASSADGLALAAQRCLLIDTGSAVAEGTPAEVLASAEFERSGVLRTEYSPRTPASTNRPRDNGGALPAAELERVEFAYEASSRKATVADRRKVLDDASLAVFPGEVLALTGPNGTGKSTAIRHLAGLLRPARGTVRIGGRDIRGIPAGAVAATVGTLFQEPRDQLFERTALREVGFGLRALGLTKEGARDRALEALDAVGLASRADQHPYELSASEQRLLALATALARRPRVLLLDEPTVGLDRHGLARLEASVEATASGGAAVIFTTHAISWARRHAGRMLALSDGRFSEGRFA